MKEASLVNVVANLRENAVSVEWRNPDPLRNLRSLTAEALVKVDEFADGRGSNISTLMGVEGHFLLRFGDTAPNNQLQVVGRPAGTTVDEKLTSSDWTVKTGYVIQVQHTNDLISVYKHNSILLKKQGDYVRAGEVLGVVGNTGEESSGPHLHFELWRAGNPLNPENFIKFK